MLKNHGRVDDLSGDNPSSDGLRNVKPEEQERKEIKECHQSTAYCGRNTRVETTVAIEFAAS